MALKNIAIELPCEQSLLRSSLSRKIEGDSARRVPFSGIGRKTGLYAQRQLSSVFSILIDHVTY